MEMILAGIFIGIAISILARILFANVLVELTINLMLKLLEYATQLYFWVQFRKPFLSRAK